MKKSIVYGLITALLIGTMGQTIAISAMESKTKEAAEMGCCDDEEDTDTDAFMAALAKVKAKQVSETAKTTQAEAGEGSEEPESGSETTEPGSEMTEPGSETIEGGSEAADPSVDGSETTEGGGETEDPSGDESETTEPDSEVTEPGGETTEPGSETEEPEEPSEPEEDVVVYIDAGHDSTHAGTSGTYNGVTYQEHELTLKIAQYCVAELEKYDGIKVYISRTSNDCPYPDSTSNTVDNRSRALDAASVGASYYIALHLNSLNDTSVGGVEVYYPNANYATNETNEMVPEGVNLSTRGKELATEIKNELVALGLNDRGVRIRNSGDSTYDDGTTADYYGLIKNPKLAGITGIIVEHAYMSNQSDLANYLVSESSLKKLGVADATAIARYVLGEGAVPGTDSGETTDPGQTTDPEEPTDYENQTPNYEVGYYEITASELNVRKGPDTSYAKAGSVTKGQKFTVTKVSGDWGRITYNGSTAWISLKYAKKTANIYTVSFEANGGEGSMEDQVIVYGVSTKLTANAFTMDGAVFKGWNAYRESDDKWYTTSGWKTMDEIDANGYTLYMYGDKASIAKTTSVNNDQVTMYAVWGEPNTFTVHFDANGGSGSMEDQMITYGVSTPITANAFTKTGYHFIGWTAYRTSDSKWYAVKKDGSKGWYTESEISTKGYSMALYKDQASIAKTCSKDGDTVVFYAQWERNTYIARFDGNGASGSMADQTITYGVSTKLTANAFSNTGYYFAGWAAHRASDDKWYAIREDGSKAWCTQEEIEANQYALALYGNKASIAKSTSVDKDVITFIAQWEVRTYTVHFDANGGEGRMEDLTVTYGVSTKLTANAFTRSGYTFKGWYAYRTSDDKWYAAKKDGTKGWYTQAQITANGYTKAVYGNGAAVAKSTTVDGDTITMYAVWK